MDYEKAYKKALETARDFLDFYKDNPAQAQKFIDIFPELTESEDERIRNLLVWQVHRNIEDETNDLAGSIYDGIKGHDPDLEESIEDWKKCLAWLEKQKEQKPAEKQDYSGLNDLERAIHRGFLAAGVENVPVTIIKETAQDCLAQIKPAEWSEEDEENFKWFDKLFRAESIVIGGRDIPQDQYLWFKSFRPQPHWKPSEEQMSMLLAVIRDPNNAGSESCSLAFKSLYDDLRKLI